MTTPSRRTPSRLGAMTSGWTDRDSVIYRLLIVGAIAFPLFATILTGGSGGALINQLPHPSGDTQLVAGVTAVAARRALRGDQVRLVQAPQEPGTGAEHRRDFGMLIQHRLAHHGSRRVDDLRPLVVAQRSEAERRQLAVGAVGHPRIDAGNPLGRGAQGRRRVAARQGQQLLRLQLKTVGLLEGWQSRRAANGLIELRVQPSGCLSFRHQLKLGL